MKQYAALQHIVISLPERYGQSIIDQRLRSKGLERHSSLHVHSYFEVPAVLAQTDYICTLPTSLAEYFTQIYPLKRVEVPMPDLDFPIYLMWHTGMQNDPGHIWLREFILASWPTRPI